MESHTVQVLVMAMVLVLVMVTESKQVLARKMECCFLPPCLSPVLRTAHHKNRTDTLSIRYFLGCSQTSPRSPLNCHLRWVVVLALAPVPVLVPVPAKVKVKAKAMVKAHYFLPPRPSSNLCRSLHRTQTGS